MTTLKGAAGDIVSVSINPDGWTCDVEISGLNSGGSYSDFGWGTNNTIESGMDAVFTVTSKTQDDAKAAGTIERTIYGTRALRFPHSTNSIAGSYTSGSFAEGDTVTQTTTGATAVVIHAASAGPKLIVRTVTGSPNSSNTWTNGGNVFTPSATPVQLGTDTVPDPWEFYDGTNTTVRIGLSDYVYSKDESGAGNSGTDIAGVLAGSIYTQGGTPNASWSGTVTNDSTVTYQPVVAMWGMPPHDRVTGDFTLRVLAFGRHAQDFRPCRAVRFTVSDGVTTEQEIDLTANILTDAYASRDAVPVIEYSATFSASSFADDATLTCNFEAWDFVGDTDSETDTVNGTALPIANYGPITLKCDSDDDLGVYAKVSSSSPSGTPATYTVGTYNFATAEAYATINAAFAAGANIVDLTEDNHTWTGASAAVGANGGFWDIVKGGPGTAMANVVINAGSGDFDARDRTKIQGATITTATNNSFTGMTELWFDQCALNSTGTSLIGAGTEVIYVTHCELREFQMSIAAGNSGTYGLVRGNTIYSTWDNLIRCAQFIGNKTDSKLTIGTGMVTLDTTSGASSRPTPSPAMLCFNDIRGFTGTSATDIYTLLHLNDNDGLLGIAMVQNVFERCDTLEGPVSNYLTNVTPFDNAIIWHNTNIGQRTGYGYNWENVGNVPTWRRYWSMVNNYWEADACKSDIDSGVQGRHGARVGNWSLRFGVGLSGNVHGGNADVGPAGYDFEFGGINDIEAGTQTSSWAQWVDRQGWAGGAEADGFGDYHVQQGSPFRHLTLREVLPFDLEGTRRGGKQPAGAYAWQNNLESNPPSVKRKMLAR